MIPGDHLQLLYDYWLFSDMVKGTTPFFRNLYEFNRGDDAAVPRRLASYLSPFFVVFVPARALFGRAAAWNLIGFVALWLTYWITWRLNRRFVRSELVAALSALPALILPYRWMAQFGGSPTGLAMLWVPLLFLGLDLLAREQSLRGALIAGSTATILYLNEKQTFLFGMLATPIWYLVSILNCDPVMLRNKQFWLRSIRVLTPLALVLAVLVVIAFQAQKGFEGTSLGRGRTLQEVKLFSPRPIGLVKWTENGTDAQIYLGPIILFLLVGQAVALSLRLRRSQGNHFRTLMSALLLWLQSAAVITFSLGPRGPFQGRFFIMIRDFVPGLNMLRQPPKVFSIMPTLMAVSLALGISHLANVWPSHWWRRTFPLLAALALLLDYGSRIRTTVCLLDTRQDAYGVVAEDATRRGRIPRALVLPIWPGDSAWASLYQHYVSLYRIRMLNGYRPVVRDEYRKNVFQALSSANTGLLTSEQIERLRRWNVDYVVLHENAFPEKVSPFPVFFTLKRLLEHPHLDLLAAADGIWAFRLTEIPAPKAPLALPEVAWFPTLQRHWEMERLATTNCVPASDPTASGGACLMLCREGSAIAGARFESCAATDAVLKVRARGSGTFRCYWDSIAPNRYTSHTLKADEWIWLDIPIEPQLSVASPRFVWTEGSVCLDTMLFTAGRWQSLAVGEQIVLPACLFFHAGVCDPWQGNVTLRPEWDADLVIFYGLRLPLDAGEYEVAFRYKTSAPPGTDLGRLTVEAWPDAFVATQVFAGELAKVRFRQQENLPVTIKFCYSRNAQVTIREIVLARVK
ncbi:MAG: hypothetical protein ACUVWX_03290 [Kiritimatiellia bacterium]